MSVITTEQNTYILYNKHKDTKLIACAGSGKTFCLITKINNQIKNKIYDKNEILVLTFSRFTRDDFIRKIDSYKAEFIDKKIVNTIDSFAKKTIDINNDIDVSLLSYRFMKYLKNNSSEIIKKNSNLINIKTVYIDEAQDLNETQFNIFLLLKKKLNIVINLVGDPNQNIYQFRNSSDKHLMNFKAKTFYLTNNFRSYKCIIDFSKYLRPYANQTEILCKKGKNNCKPTIIFHTSDTDLEKKLIDLIKTAINMKIEPSDIAILSPTRGKMRGYGKSHGLCFISNILHNAGIKFKQFYEETTDQTEGNVKYKPKEGYINLLTYMGSKGLEWKYVILVDANNCLINKLQFNIKKHLFDQYLLYVACSRAIDNMVIFSKIENEHVYKLNKWFSLIPKKLYVSEYKEISFEKINTYNIERTEKNLHKIINNFSDKQLDALATIIRYGNGIKNGKSLKTITKIYDVDKDNNIKHINIFFSKYIEILFCVYYSLINNIPKKKYIDIENIISNKCIISNATSSLNEWYYSNRETMTWNIFNNIKNTLDTEIVKEVENKFDQKIDFRNHTLISDNYFNLSIMKNNNLIKIIYDKYLDCTDIKKIRKYLFDIVVIIYSLNTQHYFHVTNNGKKFKNGFDRFTDIYDSMYNYIKKLDIKFDKIDLNMEKKNIKFYIDYIEVNKKNTLVKVKASSEITLKDVLYALVSNILYFDYTKNKNTINLKFINILKGEIVDFKFILSINKINTIIKFFTALTKLTAT